MNQVVLLGLAKTKCMHVRVDLRSRMNHLFDDGIMTWDEGRMIEEEAKVYLTTRRWSLFYSFRLHTLQLRNTELL